MQADILHAGDLFYFRRDLYRAYLDNHLIEDIQTPYRIICEQDLVDYLAGFVSEQDSMVVGIFDNSKKYCYGYIIYDNIRCADKMVAEVHIAIAKEIWGNTIADLFRQLLNDNLFDILYCQIPKIAVRAIGMCKKLGFKKTGYIPCALPYKNSKGETKLYDLNIFVYKKADKEHDEIQT